MAPSEIPYSRTLEGDLQPLFDAVATRSTRPLILWAHPKTGQSRLVESAAKGAGLPFREFDAERFEEWDGFRDVSESGHFREVTLEHFLAKGERADPGTFTLAPGSVLYLRGINQVPTRIIQAVFDQILNEGKLLNNPLPTAVRIVASAYPADRHAALELLGPALRDHWSRSPRQSSLRYSVFEFPASLNDACDHWALLPSVERFVAWGRAVGLCEELLGFLEDERAADPDLAEAELHASVLEKPELIPQIASPTSFADLAWLLVERRPYFSGRAVRNAARASSSRIEFETWLREHLGTWDPDRWSEAESSSTLRGEPVTGAVWLRNLIDEVRRGLARLSSEDVVTYSSYEKRSVEMWATQELGDDLGEKFARSLTLKPADIAHLV